VSFSIKAGVNIGGYQTAPVAGELAELETATAGWRSTCV
jgi:hypothetical protein